MDVFGIWLHGDKKHQKCERRLLLCLCLKLKVIRLSVIIKRISLFSVSGKVNEKVLTERLMEVIEKVTEEQGGFRKEKGCMNQMFVKCIQSSWT